MKFFGAKPSPVATTNVLDQAKALEQNKKMKRYEEISDKMVEVLKQIIIEEDIDYQEYQIIIDTAVRKLNTLVNKPINEKKIKDFIINQETNGRTQNPSI